MRLGIFIVGVMAAVSAAAQVVTDDLQDRAVEWTQEYLRVNTVNPSPIDTRMMTSIEEQRGLPAGDRSNRPMAKNTPLKRYGEPDEVAWLMLFLSCTDGSFCTGGVYMVDGGVSAGRV